MLYKVHLNYDGTRWKSTDGYCEDVTKEGTRERCLNKLHH